MKNEGYSDELFREEGDHLYYSHTMEHAYREITAYSESQELIITLHILLEPEETTYTTRTSPSHAWREITDDATGFGCRNMIFYFRRVSSHSPVLWTEWHS